MCLLLFLHVPRAETRSWTGLGGDASWSNPLNWTGAVLPGAVDDVLLDNSEIPVSYGVTMPDGIIVLRTLRINPSPGRNIELVLPATNKFPDAFTLTGPGYGIELDAGAVFRNASGISSGESLHISDSMMIRNGGRYIHQTRASHANSILKFLSTAPGTETGVFDFDVPKASYTISVSNRTYGSLELHASAYGSMVNYTCSGSNPLLIHGNLRIGQNVSMSMNLGGTHGNILVEGDFIQEGGQLNLASGAGENTVLGIKGDLYQSASAVITETSNGNPFLELNGIRTQEIAMAGRLLNQVGLRINNVSGSVLRLSLQIPWRLELIQGALRTTSSALLLLDSGCSIQTDSSLLAGGYIDGPMRKLGLNLEDHFLFPVGRQGLLRWLELKNGRGNYTVEYLRQNPGSIGGSIGPGLDHISKLEYWIVLADGNVNDQAKIELSFASASSGGITDPDYLNVAKFQSMQWEDAGHSGSTGNFIQGSVLSSSLDFSATYYTLASILNLENPLPLTFLDLEIREISDKMIFAWKFESDIPADHFELLELSSGQSLRIAQIQATDHQSVYSWICSYSLNDGIHYFRIRMVDHNGNGYDGKITAFRKENSKPHLSWISPATGTGSQQLMIQSQNPGHWKYEIISLNGQSIKKGVLNTGVEKTMVSVNNEWMADAFYIFRIEDSAGNPYSLLFRKD